MSKLKNEIIDLEINPELLEKLQITYPAFLDWIHSNILEGETFDDTKDFLAYLGYALFQMWQDRIPALTLDDCAASIFSDKELNLDYQNQ